MEEIQENEYCRTDKGIIFKVDKEKKNLDIANFLDVEYGEIVKHSKNIVDLIEETDFVNGQKVVEKKNPQKCNSILLSDGSRAENQDIKTILTHEIYENNCYRIGE